VNEGFRTRVPAAVVSFAMGRHPKASTKTAFRAKFEECLLFGGWVAVVSGLERATLSLNLTTP
jgi:hypothetical protein